jgi:hypothetical protein
LLQRNISSGGVLRFDLLLGRYFSNAGGLVMHLWRDAQSSKDLLEACVVFAMGLTFVMSIRWKKYALWDV